MKFQENPDTKLDETEVAKVFSPYIILPCCIVSVRDADSILDMAFNAFAVAFCVFLGNAVISATKQTLSDSLIHSDLITWFPTKVQKFLIVALSLICYFVLPAVATWMIHQKIG